MYDPTGSRQIAEWMERHLTRPEGLEERLRRFWSWRKLLYWHAVDMHEEGKKHQHRYFGVGAAALAFRPDRTIWNGQAEIMLGYNSKDEKRGIPKCCAERRLFEMAVAKGYVQVVGMVVVGEYQPDDTSGHECTTLHPCLTCRQMMATHTLAWLDMPIMTALPPPKDSLDWGTAEWDRWVPTHEWHALGEILAIHQTT